MLSLNQRLIFLLSNDFLQNFLNMLFALFFHLSNLCLQLLGILSFWEMFFLFTIKERFCQDGSLLSLLLLNLFRCIHVFVVILDLSLNFFELLGRLLKWVFEEIEPLCEF